MELKNSAIAGTTESCDVQIIIAPNDGKGVEILLESIVKAQFGEAILATVNELLAEHGITDALVQVQDKGAYDWVIRARMTAAICRSCGAEIDWSEVK